MAEGRPHKTLTIDGPVTITAGNTTVEVAFSRRGKIILKIWSVSEIRIDREPSDDTITNRSFVRNN